MKPKTLVLLCVAVGCGLVAMIGVQQAMNKPAEASVEMVQVLEALDNIDPGVPLSDLNVAFKQIPKEAAQEDCVTTLEEYKERSLTVAAVKGEQILKAKLSDPGVSGKSTLIPMGKNVITINVDETQTASGMVKAGNIVDIQVTYDARTPTGVQKKAVTLLECVTVFAIADQTKHDMMRSGDNTSVKARQVSLVVTGEEANALALAEQKGTLRLLWRNSRDLTRHNTKAITEGLLTELRGLDRSGESAAPSAPVEPKVAEVKPPEPEKQDVHQFLATPVPVEPPVVAKVEPKPEPKTPMWEVKVFVGNDVQSYPFELKDQAGKTTTETSVQSAGGFLEKIGDWKLPWTDGRTSSDASAPTTGQAL